MSFSFDLSSITHDFRIAKGRFVLSVDSETIADRINVRLQTELGEWYLNVADGIPYYGDTGILGSAKSLAEVSAILRKAILDDPDVIQINNFEIAKDIAKPRGVSAKIEVQVSGSVFGAIEGTDLVIEI